MSVARAVEKQPWMSFARQHLKLQSAVLLQYQLSRARNLSVPSFYKNAAFPQYCSVDHAGIAKFRFVDTSTFSIYNCGSRELKLLASIAERHSSLYSNGDEYLLSPRSEGYAIPSSEGTLENTCTLIQQPTPYSTPTPAKPAALRSPTSPSSSLPKRRHSARSNDVDHIPRPRNAFILFRSHALAERLVVTAQQNEASREIAELWRCADPETRARFEGLAIEEKRRHAEAYPDYKYAPKKASSTEVAAPTRRKAVIAKNEGKKLQPQSKPSRASTRARPPPIKVRRPIPTPDPTPAPSSELTSVDVDDILDCDGDDGDQDEDAPCGMFSGIFKSITKPIPQVMDGQDICIPEFTYPSDDDHLVIEDGRVPCLASSAFYNPSFVQELRARKTGAHSSMSTSVDSFEVERNSLAQCLRPIVPIWRAETDWNYGKDLIMAPGSSSAYGQSVMSAVKNVATEEMAMNVDF